MFSLKARDLCIACPLFVRVLFINYICNITYIMQAIKHFVNLNVPSTIINMRHIELFSTKPVSCISPKAYSCVDCLVVTPIHVTHENAFYLKGI